MDESNATTVVRSIIVDCELDTAYNYWRDLHNLPLVMTSVESVTSR